MKLRILFTILIFGMAAPIGRSGPPYVTDDPDPVEYQHWEVYFASQYFHSPDGASAALPQLEVNYGAAPNLQLHVIAPMSLQAPSGEAKQYGYGDTEFGAKYRFFDESDSLPEAGIFPLIEAHTGSASRGLGTGHTQVYLPLWFQKKFGKWLTYGGGGYWINPGEGNRNWWFTGLLVQRQVFENLSIGAEVFHQTRQEIGGRSLTHVNLGFVWDVNDTDHIMASAGPNVQGGNGFQAYLAFQLTLGPKK